MEHAPYRLDALVARINIIRAIRRYASHSLLDLHCIIVLVASLRLKQTA